MIDTARIRAAARLCFFAHYHPHDIVEAYVVRYVASLRDAGFTVVVLSTAALPDAECDKLRAVGAEVVLRENRGLDFGGWIDACIRFFPIEAELLMFANDSVYGPIGDLGAFIDELTAQDADFYGAVESVEITPHLQSWFLLFRPAAYRSAAFREMMCRPMPEMESKWALILRYEVGLTGALTAAGLRYRAAFTMAGRQGLARRHPYNPGHLLWRDVIERGVPFLKVELLRLNPARILDTADWREVVRARSPELEGMIDTDLARRGVSPPPDILEIGRANWVYWPEVRAILLRDYRSAGGRGGRLGVLAFRAIIALTIVPRRLYTRFVRSR